MDLLTGNIRTIYLRYLSAAFGSAATFGTLSAASAPGQPPAANLRAKLLNAGDLLSLQRK